MVEAAVHLHAMPGMLAKFEMAALDLVHRLGRGAAVGRGRVGADCRRRGIALDDLRAGDT